MSSKLLACLRVINSVVELIELVQHHSDSSTPFGERDEAFRRLPEIDGAVVASCACAGLAIPSVPYDPRYRPLGATHVPSIGGSDEIQVVATDDWLQAMRRLVTEAKRVKESAKPNLAELKELVELYPSFLTRWTSAWNECVDARDDFQQKADLGDAIVESADGQRTGMWPIASRSAKRVAEAERKLRVAEVALWEWSEALEIGAWQHRLKSDTSVLTELRWSKDPSSEVIYAALRAVERLRWEVTATFSELVEPAQEATAKPDAKTQVNAPTQNGSVLDPITAEIIGAQVTQTYPGELAVGILDWLGARLVAHDSGGKVLPKCHFGELRRLLAEVWRMFYLDNDAGIVPTADQRAAFRALCDAMGWDESHDAAVLTILHSPGVARHAYQPNLRDDIAYKPSAVDAVLVALRLMAGEALLKATGAAEPAQEARAKLGGGTQVQDESETANRAAILRELEKSVRKAYLSLKFAESKAGRELEDRDAYELLRDEGLPDDAGELGELEGYEPPDNFDTWRRYVSEARNALDEQKYERRHGRATGTSIVKHDEIEFNRGADE